MTLHNPGDDFFFCLSSDSVVPVTKVTATNLGCNSIHLSS